MKAKDLRNSIMQMAVQGKLVAQDPADEPASVLLERIREERAKLIKEKKIKAPKGGESVIFLGSDGSRYEKRADAKGRESEPACIDGEIPFEIPEGWEWARVESLGDWKAGATPAKTKAEYHINGTVPWLLTGDLNDSLVTDIPNKITQLAVDECSVRLNPAGSVLVAMYGATIGKTGVLGLAATTNQACCACILFNQDLQDWLLTWLKYYKPFFKKLGEGGAQPNISRDKIVSRLIPIPPLAEQRRIAERVSELMPLVEEYGKLEDEREALDAALPERLRKSVLQMAVEGKLVPQDPADEPASVLLNRIREERAKLIKEKKIKAPKGGESVIYLCSDGRRYEKRGKDEPVCIDEEIPFDVPEGWEWARLGSVFDMQAGKNIAASNISDVLDEANGIPCFGGNGIRGYVARPNREGSHQIIGRQGALCGCINYAQGPFYATEHAVVVTTFGGVGDRWTGLILRGLNLNQYATATAQPGLAVSKIAEVLVPIPPLAEQHRIAAQLDALLANIV